MLNNSQYIKTVDPLFNVNVKICLVYMIRTLFILSSEISTIIQGKAF